jgi:ribonuclease E
VDKVLLINADEPEEVRVALVEDGRLEEVYVEAGTDPTGKGNVYVGRVQNVEKGIGAAFVDLGGGVTGFLHASDIVAEALATKPPEGVEAGEKKITDLVKPGDPILVQVSRGAVGHKGPTLTTKISLPGRYVVLLANSTRGGVSRRIETGEERDRMRALVGGIEVPPGMAIILRTASNGRSREEVAADLAALHRLWTNLKARLSEGGGPRLVHEEGDLVSRAVRDLLPADATRIVTDDASVAARIREYLDSTSPPPSSPAREAAAPTRAEGDGVAGDGVPGVAPHAADAVPLDALPVDAVPASSASGGAVSGGQGEAEAEVVTTSSAAPAKPLSVEVHPGPTPIFHAFGVEAQMEDAFRRTIRLPSGGSIVIDPTEALVAIDVNSGRMTEEEDLETTALKTDLEAVPEVARQLRLRDLGGVIVVDFIDLRERAHVAEVERAMREALRRDRARIRMARIGPFGCLELTRQRIRPALASVTHVACTACGGAGRRRHPFGLALRVLREMRARAARSRGHGGMEVRVPPPVAELLKKRRADSLAALEAWLTGPFRLVPDATIPSGGWSIRGLPPRTPSGLSSPQGRGREPVAGPAPEVSVGPEGGEPAGGSVPVATRSGEGGAPSEP